MNQLEQKKFLEKELQIMIEETNQQIMMKIKISKKKVNQKQMII